MTLRVALGSILAVAVVSPVAADIRIGTFSVRMTVPDRCEVGADQAAGSVAVTCTNGTPFEVATPNRTFSARGTGAQRRFPAVSEGPAGLAPSDAAIPGVTLVTITY
ncbi:MAG: hypothetical protein WCH83_03230 [Alphaproteobacteria bacterium]|jgi:hypothetical protein